MSLTTSSNSHLRVVEEAGEITEDITHAPPQEEINNIFLEIPGNKIMIVIGYTIVAYMETGATGELPPFPFL